MDLSSLTISKAKKDLLGKKYSSVELTKAYLDRIKKLDKNLKAFITVCEKEALMQAKNADEALSNRIKKSLLGIPISLKDIYSTRNIKTTAASNVLKEYIPVYDATVVEKLVDAGAVILGKNNCDAWAHGASGENSDFGPTKNPYNTEYVPGGSSSGAAVSVASDLTLTAMGTDTGGSIRQPAGFTNTIGLKPTYGRVSRYGVVAMASSLDCMGHFTKSVEDSALLLNITAGHDPKDATSPARLVPDYTKALNKSIKGKKIGIPQEYFAKGLDPQIKKLIFAALKKLENLGAEIIDVSLPHTDYAIACYYVIQPAEVSSNLARFDGIRYGNARDTFGMEARRRIMLGTFTLSAGYYDAYYKKAMQARTLIHSDFEKAWQRVDVIITPTSPTPPWKIGEKTDDPLAMYLADVYTVPANVAGIPGIAMPAGFVNGLPVGVQILGPQFSESLLFNIAHRYEQTIDFLTLRPKL